MPLFSGRMLRMKNRKSPAAGERDRPVVRVLAAARVERRDGLRPAPPRTPTRCTTPPPRGVKRMTPLSVQVPPRPCSTSAIASGSPPAIETVSSLLIPKKASERLSGGPERITRFFASRDRARFARDERADVECGGRADPCARNATIAPSGEIRPPRRHWTGRRTPRPPADRSRASAVSAWTRRIHSRETKAWRSPPQRRGSRRQSIHGSQRPFLCSPSGVIGASAGTTATHDRTSTPSREPRTRARRVPRRCRAAAASDPVRDSARSTRARRCGTLAGSSDEIDRTAQHRHHDVGYGFTLGTTGRPVSISVRTTPKAQMSARRSTDFPRACSGAM